MLYSFGTPAPAAPNFPLKHPYYESFKDKQRKDFQEDIIKCIEYGDKLRSMLDGKRILVN